VGESDNKNASSDSMLSPKMCLVLSCFVLTARIHIFVGHLLCVVLTKQTAQNWTIINRAAIGGIRRLFILFFSTLLYLGPVLAATGLKRSRSRTPTADAPIGSSWRRINEVALCP
jgi:hypothetical protein